VEALVTEQIEIVCTDRGTHGRVAFTPLKLVGDRVEAAAIRKAAAPKLQGAEAVLPEVSDETFALPGYVYVVAVNVSEDFEGRRRFRFTCPICSLDKPIREDTALVLARGYLDAGRRAIDLSLLDKH